MPREKIDLHFFHFKKCFFLKSFKIFSTITNLPNQWLFLNFYMGAVFFRCLEAFWMLLFLSSDVYANIWTIFSNDRRSLFYIRNTDICFLECNLNSLVLLLYTESWDGCDAYFLCFLSLMDYILFCLLSKFWKCFFLKYILYSFLFV